MRVLFVLVAASVVACGGGAQSAVDAQAGASVAPEGGGGASEAQPGTAGALAGATTAGGGSVALDPGGAAGEPEAGASNGGTAGAGGQFAGAGGTPMSGTSGSGGYSQGGAGSSGGQAGAAMTAGSGGTGGVGGSGSAGGGGAGGAGSPGVGTVVVSWTVAGVPYSADLNPTACGCTDQFGNSVAGNASIVFSYGDVGKPLDSGAFASCKDVNLTAKNVPATQHDFKVYLARAFNQGSSSPNVALDPAVTFTATVVPNHTTNVLVDFPASGATGAQFSIAP